MKKFKSIIGIILALCIMMTVSVVLPVAAEENIALGKPVTVSPAGSVDLDNPIAIGFWKPEYLTDGLLPDNEEGKTNPLGWYVLFTGEGSALIIIDLQAMYDINEIKVFPQLFLTGLTLPDEFAVYVSADVEDANGWILVGADSEPKTSERTDPYVYNAEGKTARYVGITVTKPSTWGLSAGHAYAGFGEIEVYGSEHQNTPPATPSSILSPEEAGLVNYSFDTFKVNGALAELMGGVDGGASDKLDAVNRTVDGSDGSITTLGLRGWANFGQEITEFGYVIGDGEPVYGTCTYEDSTPIHPIVGEYATRFDVAVPTEGISGTKEVYVVAKLADGNVARITNVTVNYVGSAASQDPQAPATADASMVVLMVAAAAIVVTVILKKKNEV